MFKIWIQFQLYFKVSLTSLLMDEQKKNSKRITLLTSNRIVRIIIERQSDNPLNTRCLRSIKLSYKQHFEMISIRSQTTE